MPVAEMSRTVAPQAMASAASSGRDSTCAPDSCRNAVREADVGMAREERLELPPVVVIVPDFLAVAANRQEPLQDLDVLLGFFEGADLAKQAALHLGHAQPDAKAGVQLAPVKRLGQ